MLHIKCVGVQSRGEGPSQFLFTFSPKIRPDPEPWPPPLFILTLPEEFSYTLLI